MAEVEITPELQKELVDGVVEALDLDTKMASVAETAAKAAAEAVIAKFDVPAKKAVSASDADADDAGDADDDDSAEDATKGLTEVTKGAFNMKNKAFVAKHFPLLEKSPYATISKERRLFLGVKALMNNDQETIKALNAYAGEMYAAKAYERGIFADMAEKAGYANDAVSADGGALVPDPEFNTTIYENLPKYGVVFADGNVQTTDRTAVYALSLTGTIAFSNVAEAGAITGTKLTFNRGLQSLVKYGAIVPATEELTEDSIVDYWNIVTNEVSRAYGLIADQVVFTSATTGILKTTGIVTSPLISAGAGTTIAWDDLMKAEGLLEDGLDTNDFKFYMRKETFFRLAQLKASGGAGTYLASSLLAGWNANPNNPTTPWGTPIRFTRVLPRSLDVSANGGFVIYGNLRNYNFYTRNGLEMKILTEATVTDANSNSFNLATQDGIAMRIIVRMLGLLPQGNASKFVVIGTGTVS